ncbi:hypothetical protein Aspvir_010093 [Aspergillus viridinutans]|uniref:Uncharacterized protein n=1 Tax=Aspergillus viridinutans TaxID=75553 RepID=A0A9P3C6D0_ASPVI|nr:uncharacterized protein Aspvir_010093 [Aspergillus viridinutans]GIK05976.1 hypothetical protein Aspvir_010093 [Aspergillus viridinutans]
MPADWEALFLGRNSSDAATEHAALELRRILWRAAIRGEQMPLAEASSTSCYRSTMVPLETRRHARPLNTADSWLSPGYVYGHCDFWSFDVGRVYSHQDLIRPINRQ